jgi:hypothetical protein
MNDKDDSSFNISDEDNNGSSSEEGERSNESKQSFLSIFNSSNISPNKSLKVKKKKGKHLLKTAKRPRARSQKKKRAMKAKRSLRIKIVTRMKIKAAAAAKKSKSM